MIFKGPRPIDFTYAAQNSEKQPLNLSFNFPEDRHYIENLRLYLLLLEQAKADVQAEIDAVDPPKTILS